MGNSSSKQIKELKRSSLQSEIKPRIMSQIVHEPTLVITKKSMPNNSHENELVLNKFLNQKQDLQIHFDGYDEKAKSNNDRYNDQSNIQNDGYYKKARSQNGRYVKFTGTLKMKEIERQIIKINKQLQKVNQQKNNLFIEQQTLRKKYQQSQKEKKIMKKKYQYQYKIQSHLFNQNMMEMTSSFSIRREDKRLQVKQIMGQQARGQIISYIHSIVQQELDYARSELQTNIQKNQDYFQSRLHQIALKYAKGDENQQQQKQKIKYLKQKVDKEIQSFSNINQSLTSKIFGSWKYCKLKSKPELQKTITKKRLLLESLEDKKTERELTNQESLEMDILTEAIKTLKDKQSKKIQIAIQELNFKSENTIRYLQQYQQLIKLTLQRQSEKNILPFQQEVNLALSEMEIKIKKCNQNFKKSVVIAKIKFRKSLAHLEQCYNKGLNYKKGEDFDFEQTRYYEKESSQDAKIKRQISQISSKNAKIQCQKIKQQLEKLENFINKARKLLRSYQDEKENQKEKIQQTQKNLNQKLKTLDKQRSNLLKKQLRGPQQKNNHTESINLLNKLNESKIKYHFNRFFNDPFEHIHKKTSKSVCTRLNHSLKHEQQRNMSLNTFVMEKEISIKKPKSKQQIAKIISLINLQLKHNQREKQQILEKKRNIQINSKNIKIQITKINNKKEDSEIEKNTIMNRVKILTAIKNQQKRIQSKRQMSYKQKWEIKEAVFYTIQLNIESIRRKWNKLIKTKKQSYQKNIEEIDAKLKNQMSKLQRILADKNFQDENLRLYIRFENRLQRLEKQITQTETSQILQKQLHAYQNELKAYITAVPKQMQQNKEIQHLQQQMKSQIETVRKEYHQKMDRLYRSYEQEEPSKSVYFDERDCLNIEGRYKQSQDHLRKCQSLNTKQFLLKLQLLDQQQNHRLISQKAKRVKQQENKLRQQQIELLNEIIQVRIFRKKTQ